ncbi:DNA primase small subunit PriS [Candidatus Bathyarchaeota archaeon]|nr:DNA primase small subunit PriS [Candidatus Bathyarchaeota archaeon]
MNQKSQSFIQEMFNEFYRQEYTPKALSTIEKREFGFISPEGFMIRHKSFKNVDELKSYLENLTPTDAYYSCAYYENPEAEMDKKGWIGADLIFDVDADHIPTNCDKVHDEWKCGNCGFSGKGVTPEKCPICNGEKFSATSWPCEACLESAKVETIKLLDMLMNDFGFSDKEIHTFFSGHRGYHVQIERENVRTLDAVARKEIVDYVTCLGLEILSNSYKNKKIGTRVYRNLKLDDFGWNRRIKEGTIKFILESNEEELTKINLKKNVAKEIIQNKETVIKNLKIGTLRSVRGVGVETWRKLMEHVAIMQSAKIDTVVTTDIHRLIRMPETLHGKTGFRKVEFPPSKIDSFDPFKEAISFKRKTATVFVSSAPRFRLDEEVFGPYKNQRVTLPAAAAILLICKGKAEVAE